jgi:hypothetical protein
VNLGTQALANTPDPFAVYTKAGSVKWARVIKTAGIQPQ